MITAVDRVIDLTPEPRRIVEWGDGPVVLRGLGPGNRATRSGRWWLLAARDALLPRQIFAPTNNLCDV